MSSKLPPSIGWINQQWIDASQLSLPLTDLGVRQAVTAVERLRTYGGNVFGLQRHLARFGATTSSLGIVGLPSLDEIASLVDQMMQRNVSFVESNGEVGVTIIATPGDFAPGNFVATDNPSHPVARPTLAMHLNRIDDSLMERRQRYGQPFVITDVVQPPAASWSRQIKVRCRLHYYRADQVARSTAADATGILIDADGSVTESSIANLAIVESGRVTSPRKEQVLHGVTQSVVEELAEQLQLTWDYDNLMPSRVTNADEILLMGTDGGLWWGYPASDNEIAGGQSNLQEASERVAGQMAGEPTGDTASAGPGAIFQMLRESYDRIVLS